MVEASIQQQSTTANASKQAQDVSTFCDALKAKYTNQEVQSDQVRLPKDRSISTEIIFVGFGKVSNVQKQLRGLSSIDLSSMNINSAGPVESLGNCLERVRILNLEDNSLTWPEVVTILSCVPNVKDLILTSNQLNDSCVNVGLRASKSISALTLGKSCMDWSSIVATISSIWSQVDSLDLWKSNLDASKMNLGQSTDLANFVANIKMLQLSHNNFKRLNDLSNTGPLTSLVELDLSNCQLNRIEANDLKNLLNLQVLNISFNLLDNWKSISCLNDLKYLRHLICHENPLFTNDATAREFIIARIGSLKKLNREEIIKNLRRDSEYLYLRKTFTEYKLYREGKNDEFKEIHPRYEQLGELYGLPEDLTAKSLVNPYINIDIWFGQQKLSKKVPQDMKVNTLRMLCRRLFRVMPTNSIRIITCHSNVKDAKSSLDYELDNDSQTLHFFSVKDGQRLLVELD